MRRLPAVAHPPLLALPSLLLLAALGCGDLASVDCSTYTDPVCGINGETYQNDCYAGQDGVHTYMRGVCPPIECTQSPVCGSDGKSYQSNCFAELSGVTEYLPGSCPFSPCTGPVCGDDGTTYPSDCFASLSGVESWEPGGCPTR